MPLPAGRTVALEQSVQKQVSNDGTELFLADYGIRMTIPSDAIGPNDHFDVTLAVARDASWLNSGDEDCVVGYGATCGPTGREFRQPVKITLPHSADVTDRDNSKPVIISRLFKSPIGSCNNHNEVLF